MIILFDADSLIYSSCYQCETFDEAVGKFDEVYMAIINRLDEHYGVDKIVTCAESRGNYRKLLSKTYKANRKDKSKPDFFDELSEAVCEMYHIKQAHGFETDDLIAIMWNRLQKEIGRENVMIVSLDKDYMQIPALIYNYHHKHKVVYDVTPEMARHNFYKQMIVGDSADNVNYLKGYGQKRAQSVLKHAKTRYQYTKEVFKLFKQVYKSKAREKFIECYRILKLGFWEVDY
ncbi:MAG: putative ribonuclease H [Prokaryotic dsDNA virus sp.]|nr:MAG: putative ribonuclease H [Prokaryotic dsDNA virus sp.]|tara:strand:+ start:26684 stop:27379 length:696 start_codon:yes stop_codon:yes gene_type:complete